MTRAPSPSRPGLRRRLLRGVRWTLYVLGGLVGLALVLFFLPPVRSGLLEWGLRTARAYLPGTLRVERATWPEPGTLRFAGILWTADEDTLVSASELEVSVRFPRLLAGEVQVPSLLARRVRADVPAFAASFGGSAPDTSGKQSGGGGFGPIDAGALPFLPAITVEHVEIDAPRIRIAEDATLLDLRLRGGLSNLSGDGPWVRLDELAGRQEETGWWVAADSLFLDLPHRTWSGSLRGELGPEWPVALLLSPRGDGGFQLGLTAGAAASGPSPMELDVSGRAALDGTRIETVEGTARFRIPPGRVLGTFPLLEQDLPDLPGLDGISGSLSGRYGFREPREFWARLEIDPDSWISACTLEAHGRGDQVVLDSLHVALPDVDLTGRGELEDGILHARARMMVEGLGWIPALELGEPFADSLQAAVDVAADGPIEHPDLQLQLTAGARFGGFLVDRVSLEATAPEAGARPAAWKLEAEAESLVVMARGEISPGEETVIHLTPISVRREGTPAPTLPDPGATVALGQGAVRVERLRIEGALGEWSVDGSLDENRRGRAEIEASWPEAPAPLLARLAPVDSTAAALAARWREEGPFGFRATARYDLGERPTARSRAEVHLPGPSTLAPLLPAGANVGEFGPLELDVEFDLAGGDGEPRFHGQVDLTPTGWITGSPIRIEGGGETLRLDTLDVAIEGLRLAGRGSREPGVLRGDLQLELLDDALVRRFVPSLTEDDSLHLALAVSVDGTTESPRLRARADAGAELGSLRVPRLLLEAGLEDGTAMLTARAEEGLSAGELLLDSLVVSYRTLEPDSIPFPGFLSVNGIGPELQFATETSIHREDGWRFAFQSLGLDVAGGNLEGAGPFTVEAGESGLWAVRDLLLTGSLGRVEVEGEAAPDSIHARARVDLSLEGVPRPPQIPLDVWPKNLAVTFDAETTERWDVSARLSGMKLPDGEEVGLDVEATGNPEGTQGSISATATDRAFLEGTVELPVVLVLSPFRVEVQDGEISAHLEHRDMPLPVRALQLESTGLRGSLLNGYVHLHGTMGRPQGRIDLSLLVPQPGKADSLRLAVVGEFETGGTAGSASSLADSVTALAGELTPLGGPGLRAALVLDQGTERLMRGGLTLPMSWTDQKIRIAPPDREADLRLRSESLPLDALNAFVPARAGLGGRLSLDFRAHGGLEDPALNARVESRELSLTLPDGLEITNSASLTLQGTALAPELTGEIVVLRGTIPIPESAAEQHPVEGEALLWTLADYAPVAADSAAADTGPARSRAPRVQPKVNVKVRVPTGLWIRGRDLNVELNGELDLRMENGNPTVVGNLKARSGTLTLLGRTFDVSRGTVTFYGEETVNPRLDITLESRISSTLVQVLVTGTAEKPELELTSVPEMSETDILSLIVFGRSSNELNGDEVQLMTRQAATMAAIYGTAGLTQSLSRELGVDMLTINPSGGSEGQSTVVVGKYLDPRTLLKYEQTLQGVSEFFVSLEYRLTNSFTLETIAGPTQSGAGVSWTRDY